MLLMIDNYDSFTYNLVHLFQELGAEVRVFRNDAITPDEAEQLAPSHARHLPRPRPPGRRGRLGRGDPPARAARPTLGVCLGHQAIVAAFGGEIGQAQALLHGKSSPIDHDGKGVFAGLPANFEAGRYHSLAAMTVPAELEVTARTPDGEVMGVRHRELPIEGVQFHPESVLTPLGNELAENFLSP